MNIVTTPGSLAMFGTTLHYMAYHLSDKEPEVTDDTDMLIGCDYATVITTTRKDKLDALMALVTEIDFETLEEEFEQNCIPVFYVNGVYIVQLEYEYMSEEFRTKVDNDFVIFGAACDDVSITDCLKANRYRAEHHLTLMDLEDMESEYGIDGDEADEEKEELESSIDGLLRIHEYNSDRLDSEITTILNKLECLDVE